jgi:hypothetical protein
VVGGGVQKNDRHQLASAVPLSEHKTMTENIRLFRNVGFMGVLLSRFKQASMEVQHSVGIPCWNTRAILQTCLYDLHCVRRRPKLCFAGMWNSSTT